MQKITPCLWFDDRAEEAARFYASIFKSSKIGTITRYGEEGFEIHRRPAGSVMTVEFQLEGQDFVALNGGPVFKFNEAVSFQVHCNTQEEVDHYWEKLSAGVDAVRMAQGQVRRVLADRSQGPDRDAAGQGPRESAKGHESHAADEEDRHRGVAPGLHGLA